MDSKKSWEKFRESGKIEYYLDFKKAERLESKNSLEAFTLPERGEKR